MRWFTDEAYGWDGDRWMAMLEDYSAHIASIVDRLPADIAYPRTSPRWQRIRATTSTTR